MTNILSSWRNVCFSPQRRGCRSGHDATTVLKELNQMHDIYCLLFKALKCKLWFSFHPTCILQVLHLAFPPPCHGALMPAKFPHLSTKLFLSMQILSMFTLNLGEVIYLPFKVGTIIFIHLPYPFETLFNNPPFPSFSISFSQLALFSFSHLYCLISLILKKNEVSSSWVPFWLLFHLSAQLFEKYEMVWQITGFGVKQTSAWVPVLSLASLEKFLNFVLKFVICLWIYFIACNVGMAIPT